MNSNEKEISDLLKKIFTPILLSLGILGNIVSIIIFSKASMIKYTTFKYLLLLSILDLCVLITGCGEIFLDVYFTIQMRLINEVTCKLHSFMVIFFTHSSSMLLVCMSVDRVLVIKMKFGAKFSNPKMATRVFIGILLMIGILNLHFLIFNHLITSDDNINGPDLIHLNNSNSNLTDQFFNSISTDNNKSVIYCYANVNTIYFEYLTKLFPWIDLFFYVIFPSTVMLICSIIIIATIVGANNRLSIHSNIISRKRTVKNRQISYLLLTTNFIFILLVSPLLVLNTMSLIQEDTIKTTIVYLLDYSNHGLNFIFYGITCEKYRNELFKLFDFYSKPKQIDQKYELVSNIENRRKTLIDQE